MCHDQGVKVGGWRAERGSVFGLGDFNEGLNDGLLYKYVNTPKTSRIRDADPLSKV